MKAHSGDSLCPKGVIVLMCVFFLFGLLLLPFYRYQLNMDAISYIQSARKFAAGHFGDAVTGHWSPLFPLLLVPFVFLGSDMLIAAKMVILVFGAGALWGAYLLVNRFFRDESLGYILLAAAIPFLLSFALCPTTPDIPVTCVLLYYLYALTDPAYCEKKWSGALCGLLGGIAYLTKHYSLPFFLVHFTAVHAVRYAYSRDEGMKKLFIRFVSGVAVFLCVAAPYIASISIKYGGLMISTTAEAQQAGMNPDPFRLPLNSFVPPPDPLAVSMWEDPFCFVSEYYNEWSRWDSFASFSHYCKIIYRNAREMLRIFFRYTHISFVLCGAWLLFVFFKRSRSETVCWTLIFIVTVLPYTLGYCMARIGVEARYVIFSMLVTILTGGGILHVWLKKRMTARVYYVAIGLFCLSLYAAPAQRLIHYFDHGKDIYRVSRHVKETITPGTRLAASGDYYSSAFLAYHIDVHFYSTSENMSVERLRRQLDEYEIDYYIDWDGGRKNRALAEYKKITSGTYRNKPFCLYKRADQ